MKKPRGVVELRSLTQRLRVHARLGPKAFNAYLLSPEYRERFNRVPQAMWRQAIRSTLEAEAMAAARDPLPPPVKATPIAEGKKGDRNWRDPAERAKLAAAFAQAKGDPEIAGRILQITRDAARLACKRYLNADATLKLSSAA